MAQSRSFVPQDDKCFLQNVMGRRNGGAMMIENIKSLKTAKCT
jgi:hypothetical protein